MICPSEVKPVEVKRDVSWNSTPALAVSAIVGRSTRFKVFSVVPDGDMWKWRVSYPDCGKSAACSTQRYETRAEAGRAAWNISNMDRPSVCMLDAWTEEHLGYVGSEYAEDAVGV